MQLEHFSDFLHAIQGKKSWARMEKKRLNATKKVCLQFEDGYVGTNLMVDQAITKENGGQKNLYLTPHLQNRAKLPLTIIRLV